MTRRIGRRRVDAEAELNMPPGFRFYPTDEELVVHYLSRKVAKQGIPVPIIADVDLYKYDPWDLPEMALFGQREWYFFTPRDRKYPNGSRPNRAAGRGYWKATGADKHISPWGSNRPLGIKKALVFYHGKAPKGSKTDWIMHEYRLADNNANRNATTKKGTLRLDDWVLCRLYNKKNAWEKKLLQEQQQQQEAEEDSDSFRTLESDVELPDSGEVHAFNPAAASGSEHHQELKPVKEDNDWFQDLNLDDLQNSFCSFQSVPGLQIPPNADYYFPGVNGSPFPRTGYNPPPF